MVTEIKPEMKLIYGSGDIIKKWRQGELSFYTGHSALTWSIILPSTTRTFKQLQSIALETKCGCLPTWPNARLPDQMPTRPSTNVHYFNNQSFPLENGSFPLENVFHWLMENLVKKTKKKKKPWNFRMHGLQDIGLTIMLSILSSSQHLKKVLWVLVGSCPFFRHNHIHRDLETPKPTFGFR